MQLIDTHTHLHSPEFFSVSEAEEAVSRAVDAGVTKLLCVGTSVEDSKNAINFAKNHAPHCYASIGIHPHEATQLSSATAGRHLQKLRELAHHERVIAVGECGFDFFYNDKNTHGKVQEQLLRGQIEIALDNDLPMSFHVRGAFDEFWRVIRDYSNIHGVLHSFTDNAENLKLALERGFFIGVNGIATFTKDESQIELFKRMPLKNIVVETDSPFLTPKPKRGKINSSENVTYITTFMAELRGETKEKVAKTTTANAHRLFRFS